MAKPKVTPEMTAVAVHMIETGDGLTSKGEPKTDVLQERLEHQGIDTKINGKFRDAIFAAAEKSIAEAAEVAKVAKAAEDETPDKANEIVESSDAPTYATQSDIAKGNFVSANVRYVAGISRKVGGRRFVKNTPVPIRKVGNENLLMRLTGDSAFRVILVKRSKS